MTRHNALQSFFIALVGLWLIFFGLIRIAYAAALLTDNFDSYNNGALTGQGSWETWDGNAIVESTVYQSAPKGVSLGISGIANYKDANALSSGEMYISFYSEIENGSVLEKTFLIQNNTNALFEATFFNGNASTTEVYCVNGTDSDLLGNAENYEWHTVGFKWTADYKIQCNLDGGEWSTQHLYTNSETKDPNRLRFNSAFTENFYIDDISDTYAPPPANSIILNFPSGIQTTPIYQYIGSWTTATSTDFMGIDIIAATSTEAATAATATSTDIWHTYTNLGSQTATAASFNIGTTIPFQTQTQYYSKAILYNFSFENWPAPTFHWLADSEVVNYSITSFMNTGNATTSADFYAANVPDWYATTTPSIIYTLMTGIADLIMAPFFTIAENWNNLFDQKTFYNNGISAGNSIAMIFAYADQINQLFDFPIVEITVFLTILEIALIIWKQTHRGITLIKH